MSYYADGHFRFTFSYVQRFLKYHICSTGRKLPWWKKSLPFKFLSLVGKFPENYFILLYISKKSREKGKDIGRERKREKEKKRYIYERKKHKITI